LASTDRGTPHDALRIVRQLWPDAESIRHQLSDSELYTTYGEQPTLRAATPIEGSSMHAVRVQGAPTVRFGAFLDGVQRVRIVSHRNGIPIIAGTVAAAVRVRQHRRLVTWMAHPPLVRRSLYIPRAFLKHSALDADHIGEWRIVDTATANKTGQALSRHPAALRACAIECVSTDREAIERELAEAWCVRETTPLYIDGGVNGSARVAAAECAVGVVKSHQTLYADGDALTVVMSLRSGERSSAFRVTPSERARGRAAVMSWYLRVRDPRGEDAMFGLVRIETAETADVTRRADDVSCWVLAEAAPLALPDSRWDKMAYGIRDCEEFLKAISA